MRLTAAGAAGRGVVRARPRLAVFRGGRGAATTDGRVPRSVLLAWLVAAGLCAVASHLLWHGVPMTRSLAAEHAAALGGHAYAVQIVPDWPFLQAPANGTETQVRENGHLLGPTPVLASVVRDQGRGASVYYGQWLVFSSSDGSDPRTNGRIYTFTARYPPAQSYGTWAKLAVGAIEIVLAALAALAALPELVARARPHVVLVRDRRRFAASVFGTSDATFVFLCTALTLTALAWVILLVVPHGSPIPRETALQFVVEQYAGDLLPEPQEHYVYVGLAALAPLAVALFVGLRRAWPAASAEAPDGLAPLLLAVAGVACVLPRDVYRVGLVSGPATAPQWLVAGLCCAAVVWATLPGTARAGSARLRRAATLVLYGLAIAAVVSWRIYGTPTYDRDGTSYHLDPVLYSIAQIHLGATCLHDVVPQYGCYGEFLSAPLRLTGLSVGKVLALMAVLELVATVAILRFARALIRDPMILFVCGLWLLIVTNQVFWTGGQDIYLQYTPLRILFPALSLWIVQSWPRHPSRLRAFGLGLFSGTAVFWNLDSGVVTFVALGAFLLLSGLTGRRRLGRKLARNVARLICYASGFAAFSCAFYLFLSYKAGVWIDLSRYTVFQQVFYVTGFFMLPMPPLPDMWLVAACLPLGPMILVALRVRRGPASPRLERAAYLAVLSIGVFGYFTGRSHPVVFVLVSWPFFILAFFLIDRFISARAPGPDLVRTSMRLIVTAGLLSAGTLIYAQAGHVARTSAERWPDLRPQAPASRIDDDVAFIKASAGPGDSVGILAEKQAALIAGVGRPSAIPGTGLVETIRPQDAEAILAWLVDHGPKHLYVGDALMGADPPWSLPWLRRNFHRIAAVYALAGWGPGGRLMHLERRESRIADGAHASGCGPRAGTC